MTALGHVPTFATPLHHVCNAPINRHSAQTSAMCWTTSPYERPDLSGGRITPLVEIGLTGNLNERTSHTGGLIRVNP